MNRRLRVVAKRYTLAVAVCGWCVAGAVMFGVIAATSPEPGDRHGAIVPAVRGRNS